ncbi:hypothetical protein B0H15DRAFT_802563 [Mycena belliarum]|uniref:Uncharacterized protein n=1 Tax=Mycena belliarum TaxID=1033014 RepID=A0AAD6U2X1_9AGAR|nr:hypothetical protein B0H15DRAFT_802563 [Mycena belliae]
MFGGGKCTATCRAEIFGLHAKDLVGVEASDIPRCPGAQWVVGHETHSKALYVKASLTGVKAAIRAACHGKSPREQYYHFEALDIWKLQYLENVNSTKQINLAFLKTIALQNRRKLSNLFKSPTLLRVFAAFNRDLTHMGSNGILQP